MLQDSVNALHDLIRAGQTIEGLETFYDDAVIVQENDGTTRYGKQTNVAHETTMLGNVTRFDAELLGTAVNQTDQLVFSQWVYGFTNRNGDRFRLEEVSVQRWQNGKIVHERFYYKTIERAD